MVLRSDTHGGRHYSYVQRESKRRGLKPTHTTFIAWHLLFLVYYFYTSPQGCSAAQTTGKRLIDLSHPFDEDTIYWVTAKPLNFTVTHNGTAPNGEYWYQSDEFSAATHGGTHLDAPCHFALGRWCVSDIPIENLVVPATVVDISQNVGNDPTVHLSTDHLMEWEKMYGPIPDGSVLLIRTGWSRFWPDRKKYSGTTERKVEELNFPSIKPEVSEWLVSNRKIVGIGIDVMSIDIPVGNKEVHRKLMDKNIYGLENVNFPEPLPPTGANVYVMPMKLKGASGAPCRVFAEISEGMTNGNVQTSYPMSFGWVVLIAFLWTLTIVRFY